MNNALSKLIKWLSHYQCKSTYDFIAVSIAISALFNASAKSRQRKS